NLVPCSNMAREVVGIGTDVTEWKIGDRVSADFMLDMPHDEYMAAISAPALSRALQGVLTEYRVFPAHISTEFPPQIYLISLSQSLVAILAHLSYEEASTLPSVLFYKPIKAGDTILVQGTGMVSIFALQFAVTSSATVIVLSSSDEKLQVAAKLGAKHLINHKTTLNWDKEVLKLTAGLGVDHIIEVVGNSTLKCSIVSVKINGSIDIIGILGSEGQDVAPVNIIGSTIFKGLKLRGMYVSSIQQFKDMNKVIEASIDATRPMIDKVFNFKDA
ncbi:hypothetical protein DFH07DRAFT_679603, partial [Mycena maculata]